MTGCGKKDEPCERCEGPLDFEFTMAFQPIVDLDRGRAAGYEALVRGTNGESAGTILSMVDESNLHTFDQACRIRAIELAHKLQLDGYLSINFLPNAVYTPRACIEATLKKADEVGWPHTSLSFELVETEHVVDRPHLQRIVSAYREMGFRVALDDFGSGYANFDLLVDLRPHTVKIDRALIDGVASNERRAILVESLIDISRRLDLSVIAEGIERLEDARWLYQRGVSRHQGYYYAKPSIEALPALDSEQMAAVRSE